MKNQEVDKYSFMKSIKEKIDFVLKEQCKFDIRTEQTDEHEFLCAMASEDVLKVEADRRNYKLRFTKEVD